MWLSLRPWYHAAILPAKRWLKHELGLHWQWEVLEAPVWLPPWISPRRGFSHDASLNAKAHSNVTERLLANCLDKRDCRVVLAEGLYPWLAPLRLGVADRSRNRVKQ